MVGEVLPEGGEGGMGGSILGASENGSDLRLTAARASVVQLESFPPYFRRGEQSAREGGRGTTILCPVSWVRWWWYKDKKGSKIHNVFHTDLLLSYKETEQYGTPFTQPPPIIDNEEKYEIKNVLDARHHGRG